MGGGWIGAKYEFVAKGRVKDFIQASDEEGDWRKTPYIPVLWVTLKTESMARALPGTQKREAEEKTTRPVLPGMTCVQGKNRKNLKEVIPP